MKTKDSACPFTCARLGILDKLRDIVSAPGADIDKQDAKGRTALVIASGAGQEDCVELLLEKGAGVALQDHDGNTGLHLSCEAGTHPMVAYMLANKGPGDLGLLPNNAGRTPVDLAAATGRGEVLNALLLACSGQGGEKPLATMKQLLAKGAVPDTWAPNGSSALMLAAAIDSTPAVELLLANGATIELQDALGRTALMFAAGNNATSALGALLAAGASVSIRDRRGRNVMDYAVEGSAARAALTAHLQELESKATQLQAALLAELCGDEAKPQPAAAPAAHQKAKKAKKKKGGSKAAKKAVAAVAAELAAAHTALDVVEEAAEEEEEEEEAEAGCAAEAGEPAAEGTGGQQEGGAEASAADARPAPAGSSGPPPSAAAARPSSSSSPDASRPASGGSSMDGDDERSPSPPGSPGWCTVGKPQRSKPVPVPAAAAQQQQQQQLKGGRAVAAAGSGHAQQHSHHAFSGGCPGRAGRFEPGSLDSAASRVQRCPSTGSLSTCSGESHDTDTSRFSGSERSVLRPVARPTGLAVKPAAPAASGKPATEVGQWAAAKAGSGRSLLPPTASWANPGVHAAASGGSNGSSGASTPTWARVAEGSKPAAEGSGSGGAAVPAAAPAAVPPAASVAAQHGAPEPAAAAAVAAAEGGGDAPAAAELAALREQVAALQRSQREAELQHRQELQAVLEDAAQHEALAVQQAVSAERMNCIVRFTSFLQTSGSTLFASFPEVFGSGGSFAAPGSASARLQESLGALGGDSLSPPLGALGGGGSGPLRIPRSTPAAGLAACSGGGGSAAASPYESLLATAANNRLGFASSPPATLSSLAFPPVGLPAKYPASCSAAATKSAGGAVHQGGSGGGDLFGSLLDSGSPLSSSPLSSTPFSYHDIEARLRGEFQGNHSAFVVPAAAEPAALPLSPLGSSLLSSSLNLSLETGV